MGRKSTFGIICLITTSLFIFSIVLALKLDDHYSVAWAVVFIPIFVLLIIFCFSVTFILNNPNFNGWESTWICLGLFIFIPLNAILIVLQLQEVIDWYWVIIFLPVLILGIVILSISRPDYVSERYAKIPAEFLQRVYNYISGTGLSLILIFLLLLLLRIDRIILISWNIIFIPIWLLFLFAFTAIYAEFHLNLENDDIWYLVSAILYIISLFIFSILFCLKLNGTLAISFVLLFLPLFVIGGVATCCTFGLCVA